MKQTEAIFEAESSVKTRDAQGRRVLDEIGTLGQGNKQMKLRRITLFRSDSNKKDAGAKNNKKAKGSARDADEEDDVVLLSNLLDRDAFSATDLLALYKHRWGIEQVFQQVTETFSLKHLIGSIRLSH